MNVPSPKRRLNITGGSEFSKQKSKVSKVDMDYEILVKEELERERLAEESEKEQSEISSGLKTDKSEEKPSAMQSERFGLGV